MTENAVKSWNGRATRAAVLAAIATSVVSLLFSSGVIPKLFEPIFRPDPWTATEAREAHDDLQRQIDELRLELGR
jgi:hypothetical protein